MGLLRRTMTAAAVALIAVISSGFDRGLIAQVAADGAGSSGVPYFPPITGARVPAYPTPQPTYSPPRPAAYAPPRPVYSPPQPTYRPHQPTYSAPLVQPAAYRAPAPVQPTYRAPTVAPYRQQPAAPITRPIYYDHDDHDDHHDDDDSGSYERYHSGGGGAGAGGHTSVSYQELDAYDDIPPYAPAQTAAAGYATVPNKAYGGYPAAKTAYPETKSTYHPAKKVQVDTDVSYYAPILKKTGYGYDAKVHKVGDAAVHQYSSLKTVHGGGYKTESYDGYGNKHVHESYVHAKPEYKYGYDIDGGYNKISAHEARDGHITRGSYSFKQPDGLTRIVDYYVDKWGFHPTVRYVKHH